MCSEMPTTRLEMAMGAMFAVFLENGKCDCEGPMKLSKEDFFKCMENELPGFAQVADKEEIFNAVDLSKNGTVEFQEFAVLLAKFACCNFEHLQALLQKMNEQSEAK